MPGNRCESCGKMAALEREAETQADPELSIATQEVTAEVRVVGKTECCGDERKEYTYSLTAAVPPEVFEEHDGDGHELELDADDPEVNESGGGRYKKNMVAVEIVFRVRCECQPANDPPLYEGTMRDEVSASSFDEL
jgi:hypothetical protein